VDDSPWFQVTHLEGSALVAFARPDLWQEDAVRLVGAELLRLADALGPHHIVLDFGAVRSLSSAMFGKLIALDRKVKQAGGELALCGLAPDLLAKFASMRLDRLFHICATREEARGAAPAGVA
jgi:anti-anti-sigma factor